MKRWSACILIVGIIFVGCGDGSKPTKQSSALVSKTKKSPPSTSKSALQTKRANSFLKRRASGKRQQKRFEDKKAQFRQVHQALLNQVKSFQIWSKSNRNQTETKK